MQKFEEAMSEKRALEGRKSRRGDDDGRSRDRGSRHDSHPRMMFSDASSSREAFKKPQPQISRRDNADVDEFGRSRRKRSRSPPTHEEQKAKLAKAVTTSAAPTPSRPVIISQHSNPTLFSDKPPLTMDELNKLNAKVVKARLMGAANLEELEKEYEKEKKRADNYGTVRYQFFFGMAFAVIALIICSLFLIPIHCSFSQKIHLLLLCRPSIAKVDFMNSLYRIHLPCPQMDRNVNARKNSREHMIVRQVNVSNTDPMMTKLHWMTCCDRRRLVHDLPQTWIWI
jgi:hypothetical protein